MRDIRIVSVNVLDRELSRLFADIEKDDKNPLLREFTVLIFGTLLKDRPEFPLSLYFQSHSEVIGESLSPPFLATYGLDSLEHVERVCAALTEISSDCIPGGVESCLAFSGQRIKEIGSGLKAPATIRDPSGADDDQSADWQVTSSAGPVWGALVTGYPAADPLVRFGKVLEFRLGLEISGEWGRRHRRETVEFSGRTLLRKDEFESQLRESVRFAERQFVERFSAREIPGLNRRYQFEAFSGPQGYTSTPFTGGSAGLALSMLAMAAIDGLRVRNRQRNINPGTAFTGKIDYEGNIIEVDDSEIPKKTVAVLRSPCTRFVVPEKNYETARKTLDELEKENPDRKLELIAASDVRSVYEDDRISGERAVSVPSLAINRARRRRKTLLAGISTAVAAIALVAVGIFSAIFFTRALNSVRFDGKRIEFVNRFNRAYREVELPYHVNVIADNNYMDTSAKSHRLVVDDITGDGSRDLLFIGVGINSKDTDNFGTLHVHLFDRKGDELRHVVPFDSVEVRAGKERDVVRDISYKKDCIVDLDGDGFKEVVVCFVDRISNPSGVTAVSLKDESARTFFHLGHIQQMIVCDYDDDGKTDIVVAAEGDYEERHSVLIVLDPEHMEGSSPRLRKSKFEGYEDNVAKYLIFIPGSVVFEAQYEVVENYAKRPNVQSLFMTDDDRVQIGVCEWEMRNTCAVLLYTFGDDWSCEEVSGTGPYEDKYKLVKQGEKRLSGIEYGEYLDSMRGRFRYLDGDTTTDTPVVNSDYTELLE